MHVGTHLHNCHAHPIKQNGNTTAQYVSDISIFLSSLRGMNPYCQNTDNQNFFCLLIYLKIRWALSWAFFPFPENSPMRPSQWDSVSPHDKKARKQLPAIIKINYGKPICNSQVSCSLTVSTGHINASLPAMWLMLPHKGKTNPQILVQGLTKELFHRFQSSTHSWNAFSSKEDFSFS